MRRFHRRSRSSSKARRTYWLGETITGSSVTLVSKPGGTPGPEYVSFWLVWPSLRADTNVVPTLTPAGDRTLVRSILACSVGIDPFGGT